MAYYFAVEAEKDSYVAINIRNSKYFGRENDTNVRFECSLDEINRFTTEFNDEDSLRQTLFEEGIISEENLNKNFAIMYAKQTLLSETLEKTVRYSELRIISKELLYKSSKQMLEMPETVLRYLSEKAHQKDYQFFKELSATLPEDSVSKTLISKIASLIEASLVSETAKKELQQLNIFGTNITMEAAKILIYNTKTENGTIMSTEKVNAEKLLNILIFIQNYATSLAKKTVQKKNFTKIRRIKK